MDQLEASSLINCA